MKAISLWQPWASALFLCDAAGVRLKVHETRHWALPKSMVGQRCLIHAARRPPPRDGLPQAVEAAMAARLGPASRGGGRATGWRARVPRGAFIGTVVFSRSGSAFDGCSPDSDLDLAFGNWEPGRWAWRADDPVMFAEPIPATGRQSIWNVEVDDAGRPV